KVILELWLGKDVPYITILFTKLSLIALLIDSISNPFMIAVQASGKIKWYQIILGSFIMLNLPISYLFVFNGYPSYSVFIVLIIITVLTLFVRLLFVKKILNYK